MILDMNRTPTSVSRNESISVLNAAASAIQALMSADYNLQRTVINFSRELRTGFFYNTQQELSNEYLDNLTEDSDDDLITNNSNILISNNLRLLINTKSVDNLNIFPSVLSHEILTSSSDGKINTDSYFDIKVDYLNSKQETIASRFFINSSNAELNRNLYYSNLEESYNDINFIYDSINLSFKKLDDLSKENSIGNNIHKFFIGNTFNKIGKYYRRITREEIVVLGDTTISIPTTSFENSDTILNPSEASRLETMYSSVLRYKKDIEDDRILNSDKIISQILLNTSLSLNNIYRDSWSFNFLQSSSPNLNAYDDLSLKIFDQFPIVKLFPYLTSSELYNVDNNSADEFKNISCFNDIKTDDLRYDELSLSNKSSSNIFNYLNPISRMVVNSNTNENIRPGSFKKINDNSYYNMLLLPNSFKNIFLRDKQRITISADSGANADLSLGDLTQEYDRETVEKLAFNYNIKDEGKLAFKASRWEIPRLTFVSRLFNISSFNKVVLKIASKASNPTREAQENRVLLLDTKAKTIFDSNVKDYLDCPSFTVLNANSLPITGEAGIKISAWVDNKIIDLNTEAQKFSYSYSILGNFNFLNLFEYKRSMLENFYPHDLDQVHGGKIVLKENALITSPRMRLEDDNGREDRVANESISLAKVLQENSGNRFYSYRENMQQPFVLLKNTNKLHKLSDMKEKFINRNEDLQSQEEYFYERILIQQNSNTKTTKDHPLRNNIYSGIEKGKLSFKKSSKDIPFDVLNIQNDWPSYATRIKRIIKNVKFTKLKLNNDGGLRIINFLNSYKEKAKKLTNYRFENQLSQENKFSLVYGKEEHSFSSFEDSQFLLNSNEKFYSKNNFLLNSENVKSLDQYILENNQVENIQFDINSSDYRKFISNYFPVGFFKSEKSYLNYLNQSTKIAISQTNWWLLGFDKLLSDAISGDDSLDIAKYLVYVALMQKNGFNIGSYTELNEATNGSYNKYIGKVFDTENFKKQQSFTIRTLSEQCLSKISASKARSEYEVNTAPAAAADSNPQNNSYGELSTIGGEVYQLLFPFILHKFRFSNNIEPMKLFYSDNIATGNGQNTRNRGYVLSSDFKSLNNFIISRSFNYDAYLCEKTVSAGDGEVNTENIDNKKVLFNIAEEKSKISYIVMKDNATEAINVNRAYTIDAGVVTSVGFDLAAFPLVDQMIDPYTNSTSEFNSRYENLNNNLNYTTSYSMELQDFYKYINNNTLSKNLKNSIVKVMSYYNNSDFDDSSSITDFVNNNDSIIQVVYDLIKPIAEHFSFYYDQVTNLSIKKNIDKITKFEFSQTETYGDNLYRDNDDSKGNSTFALSPELIWDNEVLDVVKEELKSHQQSSNSLDNNVYVDVVGTSFAEMLIDQQRPGNTKARNDLDMCYNTFCNTNELEAVSHDILHYWLYSKENIQLQSISESIGSSFNEVESLLADLGEGLSSLPSFLKYINNDAKLNKISKYAIDRYLYQNFVYSKLNSSQGILNLENSLSQEGAFGPNKKLEELSKELCKKSIDKVYKTFEQQGINNNSNIDIIRLGIKYDLAKEVLENKVLHIKINIVNHKFPDVYFKPLNYYYMPCFTNILPFHYRLLKEQNNFEQIDPYDFVGYFDHNVKSLENRMSILSRDTAVSYIRNIVEGTNFENALFEPEDGSIRENDDVYALIYDQIATSNAVKYCDYVKQKVFNEKDLNLESTSSKNILSSITTNVYENMSDQEFKKVFLKEKDDFDSIINLENGTMDLLSNLEVIDNQFYAYDFLKMLDYNMSMTEFAKIFTDDIYYDIFNIKIERSDLIRRIDESVYDASGYEVSYDDFRKNLYTKKELNVGYSFIIEANIL